MKFTAPVPYTGRYPVYETGDVGSASPRPLGMTISARRGKVRGGRDIGNSVGRAVIAR